MTSRGVIFWSAPILPYSILMKSASYMNDVKDLLRASGKDVQCVENCSMENEKIYRSVDEIPDDAGYFSLIVAKEKK